jgi:hypothetical protein
MLVRRTDGFGGTLAVSSVEGERTKRRRCLRRDLQFRFSYRQADLQLGDPFASERGNSQLAPYQRGFPLPVRDEARLPMAV